MTNRSAGRDVAPQLLDFFYFRRDGAHLLLYFSYFRTRFLYLLKNISAGRDGAPQLLDFFYFRTRFLYLLKNISSPIILREVCVHKDIFADGRERKDNEFILNFPLFDFLDVLASLTLHLPWNLCKLVANRERAKWIKTVSTKTLKLCIF